MASEDKLTLSLIKAGPGGFVGGTNVHPSVLDIARERLDTVRSKGKLLDFHVLRCGSEIALVLTHRSGPRSEEVHALVWSVLRACVEEAKALKLHGAGDALSDKPFSGTLLGLGPGLAELEFSERESEPIVIFMADKASSGTWNLPLYKTFGDPFNTTGLVTDPVLSKGFSFVVEDLRGGEDVTLKAPSETYRLLSLIGESSRFRLVSVIGNKAGGSKAGANKAGGSKAADKVDEGRGEEAARVSGGGGFGNKALDQVCVVRCESPFPSVGEALEPFTHPHLVSGRLRGSHVGPLMPVPFYESGSTCSDGPLRVIAAGFQLSEGRLIGPHDMFDDPVFDAPRREAGRMSDYLRRHGPFEPHRTVKTEGEKAGETEGEPVAEKETLPVKEQKEVEGR